MALFERRRQAEKQAFVHHLVFRPGNGQEVAIYFVWVENFFIILKHLGPDTFSNAGFTLEAISHQIGKIEKHPFIDFIRGQNSVATVLQRQEYAQ